LSFCSRASLGSHEATAGTGVRADAYVFLPVHKQLWGERELNARWASSEELEAIATARRGRVVTRLYSPPRQADAGPDKILVHAAPDVEAPAVLSPLLATFAGRWPVEQAPRPRLAVCTHGTRDRCCAKWGFAVYNEARRLFAEGRSPFEPIECSHLGGDRFAATGIFFPSGSMYAHLDQVDLAALSAREAAGRLQPDGYRGRVFEAAMTQVVRAGLAREGLMDAAATPLQVRRPAPDTQQLSVDAGARRFEVQLRTADVSFFGSCAELGRQRASTARRLVYAGAREVERAEP
jgi:hypothetical protein